MREGSTKVYLKKNYANRGMEEKECDNVKKTEETERYKIPNEKPNPSLLPDCLIPMTEKQTNKKKKKTRMRHTSRLGSPRSLLSKRKQCHCFARVQSALCPIKDFSLSILLLVLYVAVPSLFCRRQLLE